MIAAVEVDDQRLRIDVERKLLFRLIDEYSMYFLACRGCDGYVYRGGEKIRRREPGALVVRFLSLFDREPKRFRAIVGRGDLKLRMAHLVDPLVENPSEILAGGLFDRYIELRRLDVLPFILFYVVAYRLPKLFFAQYESKHVQHGAAARISVNVEYRVGVFITLGDDRSAVPHIPSLVIGLLII